MSYKETFNVVFLILYMLYVQVSSCQEVRIIDNKGTFKKVNNNSITSSATAPLTPFKGDVWVDISTAPNNTINLYDGTSWINSAHIGTSGSIFFAGTSGTSTENNSQLFWDNTNNRLGIGTDSPTNKLHVTGAMRTEGILNSNGTSNEPSFRFRIDTNTGMYRPAADEIGFTVGGYDAIIIDEVTTGKTLVTVQQQLQINGAITKPIFTTAAALTLDENHHTVVLGGNHTITLPAANSCTGRVYVIKNKNAIDTTISTYKNEQNINSTVVTSYTSLWLQSDGANWQKI